MPAQYLRRCLIALFLILTFPLAAVADGTLPNGQTVSGSLTNDGSGPSERYTFDGNAGDFVLISFASTSATDGGSLCVNLYYPDGSRRGCNYGQFSLSLPSDGTYTVEVVLGSVPLHSTVQYELTLAEAAESYAMSSDSILGNGKATTGTLPDSAHNDQYSVFIPANVTFFATLAETTTSPAGLGACLQIADPAGHQLLSGAYSSINRTTLLGGYYRLIAYRCDGIENGYLDPDSYRLTVAAGAVPVADYGSGTAMVGSQTYSGSLLQGAIDQWPFVAVAGQRTTISLAGAAGNPTGASTYFDIFRPDGTKLFSGLTPNWTFTPATTGAYRVVVLRYDGSPSRADESALYDLTLTGGSLNPNSPAGSQNGCPCPHQQAYQPTNGDDPVSAQPAVGNPINVATGNMTEQATDYTTTGQNSLAFIRSYNSMANLNSSPVASSLGVNWRHNFDRYLIIQSPTNVLAERPNGRIVAFAESGGVWRTSTDTDLGLTNSGGAWVLTDSNDTQETYQASGSGALLQQIKALDGYVQTLSYSGSLLSSVTDSYGRSLGFTYNGNLLNTVTTPDGLTLTYGFASVASGSRLTSVGYNTQPATQTAYLYENPTFPFALTGVVDENNSRYLTWAYDSYGRAISSQYGDGSGFSASKYSIAYDDATGNRTVTNPLGQQMTYKFETQNDVYKISEVDRLTSSTVQSGTRTYAYDGNGYLSSTTDWNGISATFVNNAYGLPTTINEGVVGGTPTRTTSIVYDSTWPRLPKTATTSGLTTSYTYDGNGDVQTKTLADTTTTTIPYATGGATRVFTYGWANGLLTSVQGPRTDVAEQTSYKYDADGSLVKTINALGQAIQVTAHTPGGRPQTIVDANGVTTSLTYDGRQRLTSSIVQTTAGALKTSLMYDAAGNLLTTILPDGSSLIGMYDAAHRLTSITDALGDKAAYTLDAAGDLTQTTITDPASTVRRMDAQMFDALGQLTQDTGGAGQVTSYGYDPDGNRTGSTDPLGHFTALQYDALNRPKSLTDPANGVTSEKYDAHDRPLAVTTPNGAQTAYTYDGFGDLIQVASLDTGVTVYRYDAAGNRTQKVDAAGATTNATYDALNRVLTRTYPGDKAENVSFSYDQPGHGFGIGRLTGMTDQLGSLSRSYDERGNLLAETRGARGRTATTAYAYDAASRPAAITYPSGTTVTYSRDAAGQVAGVATQAGVVASGVTHLPFGPVNGFIFGNGIADTRTFDLDYRMMGLVDQAGGTPTQALTYGYDLADNVKTITDGVRPDLSQSFNYDPLDRLMSAASVDYGSFAWMYDANGNRLMESRGAASVPTAYGYMPGSNRLASSSIGGTITQLYSYTPTGQLTGAANGGGVQVAALSYNQADRVQASIGYGQILTEYGYDGFGQRLAKLVPGATFTGALFQYGQDGSLLEEADLTGAIKADYIYLDGVPIGDLAPTTHTLAYLHTDHLGTPQLSTDKSKGLVWRAAYYPFGGTSYVAGTITQNLRLPGQYFDAETQSHHNGFRDYAPSFGRYVESDPIGLGGGQASTYAYAGSNPFRFTDPSGLDDSYSIEDAPSTYDTLNSIWGYLGYIGDVKDFLTGFQAGPIDNHKLRSGLIFPGNLTVLGATIASALAPFFQDARNKFFPPAALQDNPTGCFDYSGYGIDRLYDLDQYYREQILREMSGVPDYLPSPGESDRLRAIDREIGRRRFIL